MLNVLVSTEDMSRDEWLDYRKKGIGGSDVSVICGVNKYKSAFQLWMEKTCRYKFTEISESAYWGNVMEPIIRDEFTQRTGLHIKTHKSIFQHPEYSFMYANIDGSVKTSENGNCIFEAKTSSAYRMDEWSRENRIPYEYQLQIQHYMAVTGYRGAYIAALIGGNEFIWRFVKRDDELIEMIIKLERQFWDYVETDTPPPLDGSEAAKNFLNALYNNSATGSHIKLPDEAMRYIHIYEYYQEIEKGAAEEKEKAANDLKALIGNNETASVVDRYITWKNVVSERLNTKLLKESLPELYTRYSNTSTYRRFTIKQRSDDE